MQKIRYRYTVWGLNGYIQRFIVGKDTNDAYLLTSNGQWQSSKDGGSISKTISNQRPISPLAIAHFIAEGGYNSEYFTKQS